MAFFVSLAVFSIDRFTKMAALRFLDAGHPVGVVPGLLKMTLVLNDGAAFGLFKAQAAFFAFVSVSIIVAIVIYLIRTKPVNRVVSFALGLVLGGALGNLADRIVLGRVIDFIDLGVWPVFNIADSCITIGAGMLIFSLLINRSR